MGTLGSRDALPPLRGCQAVAAEPCTPAAVLCKLILRERVECRSRSVEMAIREKKFAKTKSEYK